MKQRGRQSADSLMCAEFMRQQSDADRLSSATARDRAIWRRRYNEAWAKDFRFDIDGHRHYVDGAEARRRYLTAHEVPQVLVDRWDNERDSKPPRKS